MCVPGIRNIMKKQASQKLKMNVNQRKSLGLLAVFALISILVLMPTESVSHDMGCVASELMIKKTIGGNVISASYVNSYGEVTKAIDIGYATVQRAYDENGNITQEYFLDELGNPVEGHDGYYGIAYSYMDNKVVITYLGADRQPMMLKKGYSTIIRTLDDGKPIDDYYYNLEMQKVCCSSGYYGVHREYNKTGKDYSITCIDADSKPICGVYGYATIKYQCDSDGRIIKEQYYDENGDAAKSILGQYGEHYQRDKQNRICEITYLGTDGKPNPTNAGYTILKCTYHRDGTPDTDMYFDEAGDPIALSKGQYGIRSDGKKTTLLGKDGHAMLCLDNFLNSFPYMVVILGCGVCIFLIILPKKMSLLLMASYICFIIYETLLFRESVTIKTNFVLFSYAKLFWTEQYIREGGINNIWLFIPFGTGLCRFLREKWMLLIPFMMSVMIEATQYVTGLGVAEFDDVFGNTIGGWIGMLIAYTALNSRNENV